MSDDLCDWRDLLAGLRASGVLTTAGYERAEAKILA